MINQPEPVFSYTIPYYTSSNYLTDEIFVSEKTYEKFLIAMKRKNIFIISGTLHPISPQYGEGTSTLFDKEKIIIIIGTKDQQEYTDEILDISIAQELEKVILYQEVDFFRFLYHERTPQHIQTFIDDIQQTLEEIHLAKRLKKAGYRIHEREVQIANEIFSNASFIRKDRMLSPFQNQQTIYLLTKLVFIANVEQAIYSEYKKKLKPFIPEIFSEVEKLLKTIKRVNLSTGKGRERALKNIFASLQFLKYITKITISDVEVFPLFINK